MGDLAAIVVTPQRDHQRAVRRQRRTERREVATLIWHCWQTHTAYDPANHRALQALLQQHQHPAV